VALVIDAATVANIVTSVTEPMLGLRVGHATPCAAPHTLGVAAAIILRGRPSLRFELSADFEAGLAAAGAMFGLGASELDDALVGDCIAELANMAAGLLIRQGHNELVMGLPTVRRAVPAGGGNGAVSWYKLRLSESPIELTLSITEEIG
jgi:hypothetical protein